MPTELMLFGVRIDVDPIRKIASMNNLADYQHVADLGKGSEIENPVAKDGGYVSDDVGRARARDRKRGTPWSEEEHKRFLIGLKKVGKGDWRGISKNYVKTRTPTQVASHAQKYFLRHNTVKRRRRSSLFDITTDMVFNKPALEKHETIHGEIASSQPNPPAPNSSKATVYPVMPLPPASPQLPSLLVCRIPLAYPSENIVPSHVAHQPTVIISGPPHPLLPLQSVPATLNLSLSLSSDNPASLIPAFQTMPGSIKQHSHISVS